MIYEYRRVVAFVTLDTATAAKSAGAAVTSRQRLTPPLPEQS
jgi:hypothetical protein